MDYDRREGRELKKKKKKKRKREKCVYMCLLQWFFFLGLLLTLDKQTVTKTHAL